MSRARFHHAHLFATDLEASLAFYRRWFDAEVLADHHFAGARNVMVRIGDGRLNFYDQPPRDRGRNAVHHLGLQVEGLADLVARMAEAGVEIRSAIRELPELDYLMVAAPDGVLLELFEWKGAGAGSSTCRPR
ncbi:MAG: VOC family protein [Actinomycetota bacterium]